MDQITSHQNGKSNGDTSIAESQAHSGAARDKLMTELNRVIENAENWLKEADSRGEDSSSDTRARFEDALRTARTDLLKIEDSIMARSRLAAQSANAYVKDQPWKAIGMSAAIGLLAGVVISRS